MPGKTALDTQNNKAAMTERPVSAKFVVAQALHLLLGCEIQQLLQELCSLQCGQRGLHQSCADHVRWPAHQWSILT